MNYPNGTKAKQKLSNKNAKQKVSYSNRGMTLEEDINITNEIYLNENKAVIHKKPTPIQIVDVYYPKRSAAVIKEAYFKAKSTTDFNGIYQGRYIDFEAKETKNKTRFPLANIHSHQIEHMSAILKHGGLCFAIIRFTTLDSTYFLEGQTLINLIEKCKSIKQKSIHIDDFNSQGYLIPFTYPKRIDYLKIVDQLYF